MSDPHTISSTPALVGTAAGTAPLPLSLLVPLICIGILTLVGIGFLAQHLNQRFSLLHDASTIYASAKLITTSYYYRLAGTTMADVWERRVDASADAVFMVFEGVEWRYGDVEHLANRLAHWLKTQGVCRGQVVALMLGNCPQYVAVWLAAMKLGAATALVNTALRGQQLAHSLRVSGARIVVCDEEAGAHVLEAARWLDAEDEGAESSQNSQNSHNREVAPRPALLVATLADCGPATVAEAADTLHRVAKAERARRRVASASGDTATHSPAVVHGGVHEAVQREVATDGWLLLGMQEAEEREVTTGGRPARVLSLDALFARDSALALTALRREAPGLLARARTADSEDALDDGPPPPAAAVLVAHLNERSAYPGTRPPAAWRRGSTFNDVGLLIYTSGTTGLPKAAALRHSRIYGSGFLFRHRYSFRDDDRILTPLPLYHSAGGVVSVVATVLGGGSLVVLRRFSASSFWEQCARTGATVVQYIGELCRYLTLTAPSPYDRAHRVRLAFGNGLRADVWREFMDRFRVGEVGEFYASTEGNAGLFHHYRACACLRRRWAEEDARAAADTSAAGAGTTNADAAQGATALSADGGAGTGTGTGSPGWDCEHARAVGAVGLMGPVVRFVSGMTLLRYDRVADELVRGANGLCEACVADEPGEMAAKIVPWDPVRTFSGYYNNQKGSKSKTVTDVHRRGDIYFRTGDLLREDARGYWFFVDRVGDTFRWKGENVSTHEVEQVVARYGHGLRDACVYGAEVPCTEGRACMVALRFDEPEDVQAQREESEANGEASGEAKGQTAGGKGIPATASVVGADAETFDWVAWEQYLCKELPAYAVPLFVRVLSGVAVTGTFKYQKGELRAQGADPSLCTDPLLVRAAALGAGGVGYVPLGATEWGRIAAGQAKL